jgi:hypothetical protein
MAGACCTSSTSAARPTARCTARGWASSFLDELWRYEAAWVVPSPEVQAKLVTLLRDERRATSLHHKPYSMVSYAWGRQYQQSNQWAH